MEPRREDLGGEVVTCKMRPPLIALAVVAPSWLSPFSVATKIDQGAAGPLKAKNEAVQRSGPRAPRVDGAYARVGL